MYISNGKKLERYELTVGEEEEIQTRLGKLRALAVAQGACGRRRRAGYLARRRIPAAAGQDTPGRPPGEVAGEMVISDIRVADE